MSDDRRDLGIWALVFGLILLVILTLAWWPS